MNDLIERQVAIELIKNYCENGCDIAIYNWCPSCQREQFIKLLKALPSVQLEPSEITDEQAILHLQSTGWMQNHDREMYESGLRERLADDSGSYDSLIPCEDAISRQAAIDALSHMCSEDENGITVSRANVNSMLRALPSAQPESPRTFVELVVRYPDPELCIYKEYKGKPYYSIKYIENGKTYVGYSTYNPEVLSQYLKKYFILSAQPEYEPVKAEDFARAMSENTHYSFMAWYGEALELMERQGFVICKKMM